MSAPCRTLSDLLSPFHCDKFFRDQWERQSLHINGHDPQRFSSLLNRRDIDQIIAYTRPRFAEPSAFQTTSSPSATYVRGVLAGMPANLPFDPGLADLREAYDKGKSVVIMSMHHRWPAVATLCRSLEAAFHCPVHANMYLTPAGSQGFAAHYDPHEVFALQLEGVKYWRLYDAVEPFPMAETVQMPEGDLGRPREVCLQPGDVLYIPRGHVHDAYTKDQSSLHLTVGINVYRWADLLHYALDRATRDDVRFRESIPGGALPEDREGVAARFRQLLAALADECDDDELFDHALHALGKQFFGDLKALPGNQFSACESAPLTADTVLERSPLTVCRVVEYEQGAAIEFPGNRVTGPRRIGPALKFVAGASRFSVRDLPDLSLDSKLTLARRLVREGLVAVVANPPGTASVHRDQVRADETALPDDDRRELAPSGAPQALAARA